MAISSGHHKEQEEEDEEEKEEEEEEEEEEESGCWSLRALPSAADPSQGEDPLVNADWAVSLPF